ncbi:hypothetical protein [Cohnella nanjingensis]|uniref:Uncharacterized protein n=1 Tax=Cohnella nanjingensis TaxID=1387779 RepID=A0A7X0RQA4_9BACL|nr:hypothetical protein [Cohnella nanjingensis]MBB6671688.1 hypothetical protein [Cohnella nanjingensis]
MVMKATPDRGRNRERGGKVLFVCTKPYQYLMARLIKEGQRLGRCDIVIIDHFHEAADFSVKVRESRVWEQVFYIEDDRVDQYKLGLGPVRKFFFYQHWRKLLPPVLADIADYDEAFVAHDFVAVEYAIIRNFASAGKRASLYEEGFGNYINNSTHTKWHMKLLKKIAPMLGLPGGYFGSVRWIEAIWLQRPGLILADRRNPLRRKARHLPLAFSAFLELPEIAKECYALYPELAEIDALVAGQEVISVILTDPFLDEMPDRPGYVREMLGKVAQATGDDRSPVFLKQHPGEKLAVDADEGRFAILPKQLPSELLYLIIVKHKIRKLNLFSFGSTAILNLYDLCRTDNSMDIFIFDSLMLKPDVKVISDRFCELAERHHIQFRLV